MKILVDKEEQKKIKMAESKERNLRGKTDKVDMVKEYAEEITITEKVIGTRFTFMLEITKIITNT